MRGVFHLCIHRPDAHSVLDWECPRQEPELNPNVLVGGRHIESLATPPRVYTDKILESQVRHGTQIQTLSRKPHVNPLGYLLLLKSI